MITIVSGLPGSGKTVFSLRWLKEDPDHRVRINYDDLRKEMFGESWIFNRIDEDRMKSVADAMCEKAVLEGKDVIIDNTNIGPKVRQRWIDLGEKLKVPTKHIPMDTSLKECIFRDRMRVGEARVGRAVIERMALFAGMIDWQGKESVITREKFIVVDVDGTLADTSQRSAKLNIPAVHKLDCTDETDHYPCPQCGASPKKDWNAFFADVEHDQPIPVIKDLVYKLSVFFKVIIVSGRPIDKCGIKTEDWLHLNGIPFDHLFMRQGGDRRPDVEVKQEILSKLPKDQIAFVIDDRDAVVEMWRANGLTCLQVAEGKF